MDVTGVDGAFSAAPVLYRVDSLLSVYCWSSSEAVVLLGSCGATWAVHWSSSFGARREVGVMDGTASSSGIYSDASRSLLMVLAVYPLLRMMVISWRWPVL